MTRHDCTRTGLDRFAGMDLQNFRTSRKLLRNHGLYDLPERVIDVYTALRDSAQRSPVNIATSATIDLYSLLRDQVWFGLQEWLKDGGTIPSDPKLGAELWPRPTLSIFAGA